MLTITTTAQSATCGDTLLENATIANNQIAANAAYPGQVYDWLKK